MMCLNCTSLSTVRRPRSLALRPQAATNTVLGALAGSNQTAPNFGSILRMGQLPNQRPSAAVRHGFSTLYGICRSLGDNEAKHKSSTISRHFTRHHTPVVDHYNIRPVINIYGNVDGKDLGYVARQIQKLVTPPGKTCRGEA